MLTNLASNKKIEAFCAINFWVNYGFSQRGWCCATGPYNVTTTERYTKSSTVYRRATRSVVHTAVTLPCPSIWYPNRPNEEDCYYYRQEYL